MTELCVQSLRDPGRFSGPIVVFTDNGYRPAEPHVRVISIPQRRDHFERLSFKPNAAEYLDVERYDKILFLDVDIVAIGDVNPLFDYADGSIRGMEESPWTRMDGPSCGATLTEEERRLARDRWGINTGLLCTPCGRFREYMRLWQNEIRRGREKVENHFVDQPPFNALVFRKELPFRPYPRELIDMPPMYTWFGGQFELDPETRLLHVCWTEKERALREMEHYLQLSKAKCPTKR